MEVTPDGVELSIVVAADEAGPGLRRCLDALRPQVNSPRMEVIVADGSASESGWRENVSWLRTLRLRPGSEVPQLWSAGIEAARGRIIALTIEQCVPARDWASSVLRAHSSECVAIGGAINASADLGLADWAIYFCRYSRFMPTAAAEYLDDLAGDNCSYKRAAFEGLREVIASGFWETFFHGALRKRGDRLLFDPSVVVAYAGPISYRRFLRRRFAHACLFAARRSGEMSAAQRFVRTAASPLVPLVLFRRIAARVWCRGRRRGKFLACLPLLLTFLVSWGAGEGLGYIFADRLRKVGDGASGAAGEAR